MDNNVFNSDHFNTWQTCPKKYYYKYVKNFRLPEKQDSYKLGTSVHALAQYYLNGHKIDHLEKALDEEIKTHWESIKNSSILNKKCIGVEWGFNSRVKGTDKWINGRIDAIFYDEALKKYIIVDWKTGQNIPKNPEDSFQCKMYLYSFYNAQKDLGLEFRHEDICFQYVKTPDLEIIEPVEYSKDKEEKYSNDFAVIIKNIESTKIFNTTNTTTSCKYCPYKTLCSKS